MHDHRSHPLLQQVPLTVSPFINLPTATTLPYTYKPMPSALPPSTTGVGSGDQKPRYVVSATGHAAHPDDIIASCRALQAHVAKLQADADAELRALEERIRARELAEKRRVAPGWLDSEARLLEPERKTATPVRHDDGQAAGEVGGAGKGSGQAPEGVSEMGVPDEGEQLDRAFGGLTIARGALDQGAELDRAFGGLTMGKGPGP